MSSRHAGRFRSDIYRRASAIKIKESYVSIEGLQFDMDLARRGRGVNVSKGVATARRMYVSPTASSVRSTRARRNGVASGRGNVSVWNNVFYG